MSWVANEWKDGLPPRALQKIAELETQLERLKKERQQKQFQFDSLEQVNYFTGVFHLGCLVSNLGFFKVWEQCL